ncbi:MAG: gamma-glutamyltransferase [Novosphingobium sp.]
MTERRLLLTCAALLALASNAEARTAHYHHHPAAPPALFEKGMVSAADPRAAEAGAEMLRAGGSATDAAIATMLALTVVEPQSSGIGGGGFYVATDAKGKVETIDGRETAPKAAHGKWFWNDGVPMGFKDAVPGGTSVGVPGNMALAAQAHSRHGKLAWRRLFAPAIRLAGQGWSVSPRFHDFLESARGTAAFIPEGAALFYDASGRSLATGAQVKNPALAKTLAALSLRGPRGFYTGPNAAAIVSRVNTAPHNPEPMTLADIASYRAKDRAPLCGTYRGFRICGMGPPSSGETTVFAVLKQLERFDLTALGPDSPVAWHLIAESERLAYADRARYLGDPDFNAVPAAGLVDPGYLAQRSELIDPAKTMAEAPAGTPPGAKNLARTSLPSGPEHGTSHFAVVDRWGSAVSYTSTVESAFGSGLVVGGYYLNNELTDFDFQPDQGGRPAANRVEAGKRPRSSMAPTLVYAPGGHLRLVIGAAGGATIPAQVAKAIIGVIDWKLSAEAAIALPTIFAPDGPSVFVEKGTSLEAMIPALTALGHADVRPRPASFKGNAVEVVDGKLIGAPDRRSEGRAVSE